MLDKQPADLAADALTLFDQKCKTLETDVIKGRQHLEKSLQQYKDLIEQQRQQEEKAKAKEEQERLKAAKADS